jgi:AcrR family transcriptional regulator
MPEPADKRQYDATKRRERADAEREETRNKVVAAARQLFVEQGYTATTIKDIARVAGVALQSVYSAGGSKAELLVTVSDQAIVGDNREVPLAARANLMTVLAEADPARRVRLFAEVICDIQERSAPVQVAYREAAAVDATVAENLRQAHLRRWQLFGMVIDGFADEDLALPKEQARVTAWSLGSSEVWLLQVKVLERTPAEVRAWLTDTLVRTLLG